jgi:hypothetical protein
MFVDVHAHRYACMFAAFLKASHIYAHVPLCRYTHARLCMCTHIDLHRHAFMSVHTHARRHHKQKQVSRSRTDRNWHVHLDSVHTCIHTCISIRIHMYPCMYVCMYVCMYTCMHNTCRPDRIRQVYCDSASSWVSSHSSARRCVRAPPCQGKLVFLCKRTVHVHSKSLGS